MRFKVSSVVILAKISGQIANKGFKTYYGKYRPQLTFPTSPKQNSCSNSRNRLKLFFNTRSLAKIDFLKFFSISQMLGIVTYVLGHQESIAPMSLSLTAKNG